MKTKILTTIFLMFVLQTFSFSQTQFGLKGGVNLETEIGNLYDKGDYRTGFNFGYIINHQINEILSLQGEFLFQEKGSKNDGKDIAPSSEVIHKYNYLSIPVFAKLSFGEQLGLNKNHKIFFNAGPFLGMLVDAKEEIKLNGNTDENNITSNAKNIDSGISFGGGYQFPIKGITAFIDLRYDLGLNKINDHNDDLRNKTLALNVGMFF